LRSFPRVLLAPTFVCMKPSWLPKIPGRAFLDTSVVNFILDFGEYIHDGVEPPPALTEYQRSDIDALYNLFLTGQRASWQLAISPHTYSEVTTTTDPRRRESLESWFFEIWHYWQDILRNQDDLPSFKEAEDIRVRLLASDAFQCLPQLADRVLLADAVVYRCDCFCTRDWDTIIKHRDRLKIINMPILTPTEWWKEIQPFAALWA